MTPNEVYESFIIKTNENAQTDNISVNKGIFVKLFNEASNKFVEWVLEKKNEDDIRYLRPILKTEVIRDSEKKENFQLFKLPTNFFDLGNVSGKGSSSCCKKVPFDIYEIKVDNQGSIIDDELSRPDAEYREAPYYLEGEFVKILTDNFIIDEITISFYKYPQYIKLINPDDPESRFENEGKELEFDDKVLDRIISIAASDNSLNTGNPKFQADKTRVISKF